MPHKAATGNMVDIIRKAVAGMVRRKEEAINSVLRGTARRRVGISSVLKDTARRKGADTSSVHRAAVMARVRVVHVPVVLVARVLVAHAPVVLAVHARVAHAPVVLGAPVREDVPVVSVARVVDAPVARPRNCWSPKSS